MGWLTKMWSRAAPEPQHLPTCLCLRRQFEEMTRKRALESWEWEREGERERVQRVGRRLGERRSADARVEAPELGRDLVEGLGLQGGGGQGGEGRVGGPARVESLNISSTTSSSSSSSGRGLGEWIFLRAGLVPAPVSVSTGVDLVVTKIRTRRTLNIQLRVGVGILRVWGSSVSAQTRLVVAKSVALTPETVKGLVKKTISCGGPG